MTKAYKLLNEILNQGGVVAASDWTNGSGRSTSKKAIPVHCKEIYADHWDIGDLKGEVKKNALKLLRQRPSIRKLIVITNLRAARRLTK